MTNIQTNIEYIIKEYLKDTNPQSKVVKLNVILETLYRLNLGEEDWYNNKFQEVIRKALKNKEKETGINYNHIYLHIMQLRSIRNDIIHILDGYDKSIKLMKSHTNNSITSMKLEKLIEHFEDNTKISDKIKDYCEIMEISTNQDKTNNLNWI